jgi:hypothetical protein
VVVIVVMVVVVDVVMVVAAVVVSVVVVRLVEDRDGEPLNRRVVALFSSAETKSNYFVFGRNSTTEA